MEPGEESRRPCANQRAQQLADRAQERLAAQQEAIEREQQRQEFLRVENRRRAINKFTSHLLHGIEHQASDYALPVSFVAPFGVLPPTEEEDFDLPDEMRLEVASAGERKHRSSSGAPQPKFPRYKTIHKNYYRPPLQRSTCPLDEVPRCVCVPEEGCGEACQNRLLFMECAVGCCSSLLCRESSSHSSSSSSSSSSSTALGNRRLPRGAATLTTCHAVVVDTADNNDEGSSNDDDSNDEGEEEHQDDNNEGYEYCHNTVMQTRYVSLMYYTLYTTHSTPSQYTYTSIHLYLTRTFLLPLSYSPYRSYPRTEVFPTSFCGFGLKLLEAVGPGCVLIEYTGEVITSTDCNARMAGHHTPSQYCSVAVVTDLPTHPAIRTLLNCCTPAS